MTKPHLWLTTWKKHWQGCALRTRAHLSQGLNVCSVFGVAKKQLFIYLCLTRFILLHHLVFISLKLRRLFFFREKKKEEGHLYLAGNHYLADVRLSDEDALVLCKSLAANKYIVSLDLRYNHITDEGCRNIQAFLEVATTAPMRQKILKAVE